MAHLAAHSQNREKRFFFVGDVECGQDEEERSASKKDSVRDLDDVLCSPFLEASTRQLIAYFPRIAEQWKRKTDREDEDDDEDEENHDHRSQSSSASRRRRGNACLNLKFPYSYMSRSLRHKDDVGLYISVFECPSTLPAKEAHPPGFFVAINDNFVQLDDRKIHGYYPASTSLDFLRNYSTPGTRSGPRNVLEIRWKATENDNTDYVVMVYLAEKKKPQLVVDTISHNSFSVVKSIRSFHKSAANFRARDIIVGPTKVSLLCPISRARIVTPVRGIRCRHLQCFDAASFVAMNMGIGAKFLCPICEPQTTVLLDLVVDGFFEEMLKVAGDTAEVAWEDGEVIIRQPLYLSPRKPDDVRSATSEAIIIGNSDNSDVEIIEVSVGPKKKRVKTSR